MANRQIGLFEMPDGIPQRGDRAAFRSTDYPELHADDIDTAGGIHHTLGLTATQAAAGNHDHIHAIHDNVSGEIAAIADKPTPVDADVTLIEDSAAANAKKKLSWANIKATLKTYFDTLYAVTAKGVTNGDTHDHNGGDGAQINHTTLSNIGTNTHEALDTFVASKAAASGLASLNASSLVVQNPANATATPTANTIPIADANGLLTPWVIPGDWPLKSAAEGDHFLQNGGSYPAGWTEADAASTKNTNTLRSFWTLGGTTAELAFKYRKQTGVNIENTNANAFNSFLFGPIYFRDGAYPADLIYKIGIYRDNAGAIDEQTYIRVVLKWDSATTTWQVYAEEKDGTTAHASAAKNLSFPLEQPLYFRVMVRNEATKKARGYVGAGYPEYSHTLLLDQTPTSAPTWGAVWMQIEQTRGNTGVNDFIQIGSVDYYIGYT